MIEEPTDPRERLLRERTRVCDRLRSLPLSSRYAEHAELARSAAQQLADIAARASGLPRRLLPREDDSAVVHQVAVTAADVDAAAGPWEQELLAEAADVLTGLRRSLP